MKDCVGAEGGYEDRRKVLLVTCLEILFRGKKFIYSEFTLTDLCLSGDG